MKHHSTPNATTMRCSYQNIFFVILFFLSQFFCINTLTAQCTSGCNQATASNTMPGTNNFTDVFCITTASTLTYNQNFDMNGGTTCVGPNVTFSASGGNWNGNWTVNNYGNFSRGISLNSGQTFNNYGTFTGSVSLNGGTIVNYNGATFTPSSFNFNGGSFTNNSGGTATFGSSVTVNSGAIFTNNGNLTTTGLTLNSSATATLGGTIRVNGNIDNNGTINITGLITVTGNYNQNSSGVMASQTGSQCNALNVTGSIQGQGTYNGSNGLLLNKALSSPACTSCLANGATTTPPGQPASQITGATLTSSANDINGSITNPGGTPAATHYIVLRRFGTTVSDQPSNYVNYTVGSVIGNSVVVAVNAISTLTFTDANVIVTYSCGTYYYAVFPYNASGNCGTYNNTINATNRSSIAITTIAGTVGTSKSICSGSTSGTLSLTGYTGTIIRWESSISPFSTWSPIANTTSTYTSGALTQTTQFRAVVNAGICSNLNSAAATITVNPVPSVPTGTGAIRCGNGTVTLTATPGTGETIDWYAAASGGTALLSGNTSYTTASLSSTTIYYAQARNTTTGCISASRTTVTATVNPSPSVTLSNFSPICSGTANVNLAYSSPVNSPDEYYIDWSSAANAAGMNDVNWTALSGGNIPVTGLISTAGSYAATILVRNSSTGCQTDVSNGSVVSCGTAFENNPITLAAPASGVFTAINFASYGLPNGSCGSFTIGTCHATTSLTVVQNAALGNNSFTINANNTTFTDPCVGTGKRLYIEAVSTAQVLNIYAVPTVASSTGASRCGTGAVTLAATASSGATIDWYAAASGGTALATGTTSYTTSSLSSNTIYYAEARNTTAGCLSASRTAVTATITAVPATPSGTNSARCGNGTVTLTATPGAGETIDWYAAASGGTALATGSNTYTTTSLSSTTIYYAEARNTTAGCLSASRTAVTAIVNSSPSVTLSNFSAICLGTTSTTLTYSSPVNSPDQYSIDWSSAANAAGMTDVSWTSLSGGIINVSGLTSTAGNYAANIYVRNSVTGCQTDVSNASAVTCGTVAENGSLTLTAPGTGVFTAINFASYGTPTGSCGSFATSSCNAASSVTVVQNAALGKNSFTLAASNGVFGDPCSGTVKRLYVEAVSSLQALTINALPTVTAASSVCMGSTITLSPITGGTWVSNNTAVATITNAGVVTPVAAGTVTFTFTLTSTSCSNTTSTVTVNALPTVTAAPSVCMGSSITLSPTTGGTWVSSNTAVATVTNAGVVTPVAAGTAAFIFTQASTGCSNTTSSVTVNALPAVTAASAVCIGSTITLSPTTGGTWISSNAAVATITNAGVVTPVAAGTVTFTFTDAATGCSKTTSSVTVNALPAVTAASAVCIGSTITLSPTTGGTWISSNAAVATITNAGVVTPVAAGTVTFTFTQASTSCSNTTSSVTVNALPTVTALSSVCVGSTITLSPVTGGTWISSNTARATVANSGVVTGVAAGAATFTFTEAATGCSKTTSSVTVNALPAVTAASAVCIGSTITLSPTTGGTWISSNATVASVTNAGVVTGVAAGTATFTFTLASTGCSNTTSSVTVNSLPVVSAPAAVCVGSNITLSPTTGGTWATNNAAKATVTNAGIATGVGAGTVIFTFTQSSTGCSSPTSSVTVNAQPTLGGPSSVCIGSSITLTPITGGTWTSSNTAIATITNAGVVTTVATGTVTFTYSLASTGCTNTSTVTVNALPTATAPAAVCVGSFITLSPTTGGTWASSSNAIATVTNAGVATGVSAGSAIFTYTLTSTGCSKATSSVTVNALPTVTAASSVCIGSFITLSPTTGGTWASSSNAIATVTNAGVATGVAPGSAIFTYTLTSTGCSKPASAVTVNALPTVTAASSVCIGSTITLSPVTGGTWTSSNAAVASVTNAGVVTGVAAGSATFTFTQSSTGCSNTTSSVTVNSLPVVSAPAAVCVGSNITLSPVTGGIWASSNIATATVTNAGVVTGAGAGSAIFTFTQASTGCSKPTSSVTVNAQPTLGGPSSVCMGSSITLTPTTGGTWASSNTAIATINNAGVVTTVAPGSVTFTYTLAATGCTNISTVTVNALPIVTAPTAVCVGGTITLSPTTGGTWTSSNAAIATVTNAGVVTGVAAGSVTFTFAQTSTGCSNTTTAVTVNALPADKTFTVPAGTICSGLSVNIQLAASQSGVNYQLRNNATNALVGSVVAGTGLSINLPTGTLVSTSTFNILATLASTGCTTQMSSTVTVIVNASGQWIGGSSGNWNLSANWCGGVPTGSTDVNIPAGTTITIQSGNATANSVTIAGTSSLVMTGAYNLNITAGGTFTNNGTFDATASTGSVVFLGNGSISGTTIFKNIDTYGALDFGTASTIAGTFSLQTGGSVTGHSPTYTCPSAVLLYKPGSTFSRGLEWTTASSGAGYPANVWVQNNTTINFPAVGNGFICYDLTIDNGSSLMQDYSGGSASLRVGRNVTITGTLSLGSASGGDIYVGGNWTRNTGAIFNANDRKVTFDGPSNFSGNGTSMSTITAPASAAKNNEGGFGGENFAHLWINKTNATDSVVLLSNITVNREIGFTKGTFSLRNSDVTIVSNSTRTADIAPVTTPSNVNIRYAGTGRFVVQRFIQNPTGVRTWRLLTAPLQIAASPSINAAWQEGVVNPDKANPNGSGGIYNPWPGYGVHITGPGGVYSATNGFDQGTNSASVSYANAGVTTWTAPLSTITTKITDKQGWMLFVRGTRGYQIGNQYVPSENTTLEPKGKINTGDIVIPIVAGKQVIGNPYASAISLLNVDVAGTAGKNSNYQSWDPKMFTSYAQPGKWVAFTGVGNSFVHTTSQSAYASNGTIESGQAFVIDAAASGNFTFHESDKLALTSSLTGIANGRPMAPAPFAIFRSDIYTQSDSTYKLTDGVLNIFNTAYSNTADEEDNKKMINFSTTESLSILRDSVKLAIEKRSDINAEDTIPFTLSKFSAKTYQFRFEASNFAPGYQAFLEDNFTASRTPVSTSGVTVYNFTITADSLSKAANRFRVVFKSTLIVLPVTFTNVIARQQNKDIAVEWKVDKELNIQHYVVEKSADGVQFEKINTTPSAGNFAGNHTYNFLDENAVSGYNYYRIVSVGNTAKLQYSKVVKVYMATTKGSIVVYPNPVTDGVIKLRFDKMEKGAYRVRLLNNAGQLMVSTEVNHTGGTSLHTIIPKQKMGTGIYNIEIENYAGEKQILQVIVQ